MGLDVGIGVLGGFMVLIVVGFGRVYNALVGWLFCSFEA
jgi:hypothetical protein